MNLIGLTSPASRSGKDTVANYLVEKYGYKRYAFADPLRLVLLEVMDMLDPELADMVRLGGWDALKKEFPQLVGAMIALGAGMRKHVDENVWVRGLYHFIGEHGGPVVVSDVRHPNEIEAIQQLGGQIWRINRADGVKNGMDSLIDHIEADYEIGNTSTLAALREVVDIIMREKGYGTHTTSYR